MKTALFQSCGHCWVFQICWHIECSTFTALFFRILNNSAGVQSPPLALFIVMLLRPTWLHASGCLTLGEWPHHRAYTGHQNLFLYSSPMYSCRLFLISYASVRCIPFLSFIVPVLAWNIPLISPIFLKRSLVFPILFFPLYFFALFIEEGLLISCCYSLELCIQFAYLSLPPWGVSLFIFPQLLVKPPQTTTLLAFLFLWDDFCHCLLYNVTNFHS